MSIMRIVTADQMREMDRLTIESFGIPGRILMENAGREAAKIFMDDFPSPLDKNHAGVIAGRGNNGGDGFVIARRLRESGVKTAVYLLCERSRVGGDAAANLDLLDRLDIELHEIPDARTFLRRKEALRRHTLFIDAMLGTGLKSDVRGHFKDIMQFLNDLERPVYSVDVPSGLDSDTGMPRGTCVRATATATFAFAKIGLVLLPGAEYAGKLEVVDIGIPRHIADHVDPERRLITSEYISSFFKPQKQDAHKGDNGHALVVAGSPGKTGAAAMTGMSAMRAGAGLVTIGIPRSLNNVMETLAIEAMTHPLPESGKGCLDMESFDEIKKILPGKSCMAIGPGLGVNPGTEKLARALVLESRVPMIIDADGLNSLVKDVNILKKASVPVIITPHPGEMARLIGSGVADVQKERIDCARALANDLDIYVVLKGARTVVASPGGKIHINSTGNPGMASGGMGDVLTGIIAGLISRGLSPENAAVSGVYIHGAAADELAKTEGRFGFLATDAMKKIPAQIDQIVL